jgi:hypothetical protein
MPIMQYKGLYAQYLYFSQKPRKALSFLQKRLRLGMYMNSSNVRRMLVELGALRIEQREHPLRAKAALVAALLTQQDSGNGLRGEHFRRCFAEVCSLLPMASSILNEGPLVVEGFQALGSWRATGKHASRTLELSQGGHKSSKAGWVNEMVWGGPKISTAMEERDGPDPVRKVCRPCGRSGPVGFACEGRLGQLEGQHQQ